MVDGLAIGSFGGVDYGGGGHFFDACVEDRVDFVAGELFLWAVTRVSGIQGRSGREGTDLGIATDGLCVRVEDTGGR